MKKNKPYKHKRQLTPELWTPPGKPTLSTHATPTHFRLFPTSSVEGARALVPAGGSVPGKEQISPGDAATHTPALGSPEGVTSRCSSVSPKRSAENQHTRGPQLSAGLDFQPLLLPSPNAGTCKATATMIFNAL